MRSLQIAPRYLNVDGCRLALIQRGGQQAARIEKRNSTLGKRSASIARSRFTYSKVLGPAT